MSSSDSHDENSVTEVAEESFVRERPLEIERGTVLAGRYQVEEIIGKGGSGVVLRVFDRTVQNVVALKVLKSELARDSKWDKRFSRELRLGRPIQHPNVCRIFDIGEADGHRFLTMELATGGSLRDELKRRPALERPIEDRLKDARAAVEGLAAIHATGVVHRDFKPDNLLRMEDGRLVISDFGLATDAAAVPGVTVMIGTPHYMAPEVLAGEPATARSDVWALGVVLHEIFFGRRPERKTTSFDGSGKGPVRPQTAVERAALRISEVCLSETPAERPADARVVSNVFADLVSRGDRSRPRASKVVAASASVVVMSLAAGLLWRHGRPKQMDNGGGKPSISSSTPTAVGAPQDWTRSGAVMGTFSGRIHCFSLVDRRTARLIWGTPRQATDLGLDTGQSKRSNLVVESYRSSCPDVSVKTGQLLYSARNAAGANEVRLSIRRDGSESVVVTSGRDPRWLGVEPAFAYLVDEAHLGVFSLPTMQLSLLPMRADNRKFEVGELSVSPAGNLVAATGYDSRTMAWVDVWQRDDESLAGQFALPLGSHVAFGWRTDQIFVSGPWGRPQLSVARLDTEHAQFVHVGHAGERDITRLVVLPDKLAFIARRIANDVWSYDVQGRRRITTDSDVYSAAVSGKGDLLLGKRADDGVLSVWLRHGSGQEERLTGGPKDVTPSFGPDGIEWTYADYSQSTIRICDGRRNCRTAITDRDLPSFPTFSPSGRHLAYLTQMGRTQMKVVTADGGATSRWDALSVCGPVWSSDDVVWSVENVHGAYFWSEHNAITGESTGRRVAFANDNPEDSPMVDCRPAAVRPGSPLFRGIQVEADERSEVFVAPRERLEN